MPLSPKSRIRQVFEEFLERDAVSLLSDEYSHFINVELPNRLEKAREEFLIKERNSRLYVEKLFYGQQPLIR